MRCGVFSGFETIYCVLYIIFLECCLSVISILDVSLCSLFSFGFALCVWAISYKAWSRQTSSILYLNLV